MAGNPGIARMIGRKFRLIVRCVFYIVCFAALLIPILACCGMVLGDGPTDTEILGLTGRKARDHLTEWPENVTETDVIAVWYKCESGLDNYTPWYRVQSTPEAARAWAVWIHERQLKLAGQVLTDYHEGYEGVRRTISGTPPRLKRTAEPPQWWTPPQLAFRATEVMLWYRGHHSGVGRATYSAFDSETKTLWISDCSVQHGILWEPGQLPDGDVFRRDP